MIKLFGDWFKSMAYWLGGAATVLFLHTSSNEAVPYLIIALSMFIVALIFTVLEVV